MGDWDSANIVTVQASQAAESVRLMDKVAVDLYLYLYLYLPLSSPSLAPHLSLYLYRFLYLGAIVKLPGATIKSSENTQSFLLIYLSTCILWMQQLQIQIHACCALVFYFYYQLIYLQREILSLRLRHLQNVLPNLLCVWGQPETVPLCTVGVA